MPIKKIQLVTPFVQIGYDDVSHLQSLVGNDIHLSGSIIDFGPTWLESPAESGLAIPGTVAKIIQAEQCGIDAVIVNCMSDSAVQQARTCVSIPVLGPCETSMNLACQLGFKYSIVTMVDVVVRDLENYAENVGAADKLSSVRSIQMSCEEMLAHPQERNSRLLESAIRAIQEDGADVIVLGCTEMAGSGMPVKTGLLEAGIDVPVIDPLPATVQQASMQLELNVSHSKRSYPTPEKLEFVGCDFPGLQSPGYHRSEKQK